MKHRTPFWQGAIAVTLIGAGFLCGFQGVGQTEAHRSRSHHMSSPLQSRPAYGADETDLVPTDTYLSVLNTIRTEYAPHATAKTPDALPLTYAGISGMLATLHDRYTEFWTPKEYAENMEETSGVFAGIGASMDQTKDGHIVVIEPIENSPAAKMGMRPGDIVTYIDGKPLAGKTLDATIEMIKGDPGTAVRLTIVRKGTTAPIQMMLTRALVASPLVQMRMEDPVAKIGYVSLTMFGETADEQFGKAIAKLEKQGMRGLIFDLRDNPGGLLTAAQEIASRFVSDGPVVWIQEKNGKMSPLNVQGGKHTSHLYAHAYPIVVLVNGNSASAAEIVSGAIKDHKVGTLVGTRTFGKGLVQTIIPLEDDSAVKITTQHYFTPNKIDINKKFDPRTGARISGGIIPDVPVNLTDADWNKMRDARRVTPQDRLAVDKFDPQMRKALEILRSR